MVNAARVQRARASALLMAAEVQVAAYDDGAPGRDARSRRISTAKRDLLRALRTRGRLHDAIRAQDAAAAHAVRRLLDEGLTAVDAAVLVGLTRSQVKRLLRVHADSSGRGVDRSSPGRPAGGASNGACVDPAPGGADRHASIEGNR